jgi:NAD-dependent SIR2 family protein deacetylase
LNTCIKCHNVYDLNDTSMEQKLIDERFCPRCWKKYIDVD